MNNNNYLVYCHINKICNKVYVGITKQSTTDRWQSGEGYKRQAFYKVIQEFGWDAFEHIVVLEFLICFAYGKDYNE